MDKTMPCTCGLEDELNKATDLLVTLCSGLEANDIPMPPELLDWWCTHKKANEPRIQLVNQEIGMAIAYIPTDYYFTALRAGFVDIDENQPEIVVFPGGSHYGDLVHKMSIERTSEV